MEKILTTARTVEVQGFKATIWRVKNKENATTYHGILLQNGDFFIPINGGQSGHNDYDILAKENVAATLEKINDPLKPVDSSFKLMNVLFCAKRGQVVTTNSVLMGVTGIKFESQNNIIKEIPDTYPEIEIEPEFA